MLFSKDSLNLTVKLRRSPLIAALAAAGQKFDLIEHDSDVGNFFKDVTKMLLLCTIQPNSETQSPDRSNEFSQFFIGFLKLMLQAVVSGNHCQASVRFPLNKYRLLP